MLFGLDLGAGNLKILRPSISAHSAVARASNKGDWISGGSGEFIYVFEIFFLEITTPSEVCFLVGRSDNCRI